MTMKKLDMRELARIGAQQTIDAIRAEFPELFPTPKPAPKPLARKKHWTQTPIGRQYLSRMMKRRRAEEKREAQKKTRKGKAR